MSTSRSVTSASPTSASPVTTLNRPAGRPACTASSANRSVVRGVAGAGLTDHCIARGERGAGLPDRHDEREVPRRDAGDHPDGPAGEDRRVAVRERPGAGAVERAGGAGEEPQVVDAERQLAVVGGRPWLAGVLDLELREVLGVGLERVGEAEQRERPLSRRLGRPLGLGGARGGGGLVDVGDARRRERRDVLLGGRIRDDGVAAGAGAVLADEGAGGACGGPFR